MSSNFGYTYNKKDDSSDAQMQYANSKIDGIKMHFEDLQSYFEKNKNDLEKDKQFYWSKKIDQLQSKVGSLPV